MLEAKEMRKLAEQVRNSEANDFYFNKLEKRIFGRIEKAAKEGKTILIITHIDELNSDRWMDSTDVLAILKSELEKLGYKYIRNTDVEDGESITITW